MATAAPTRCTLGLGNIDANAINPAVRPAGYPYQPVTDFAAISSGSGSGSSMQVVASMHAAATLWWPCCTGKP